MNSNFRNFKRTMKFIINNIFFETNNSINLHTLIKFLNLDNYPLVIEKNNLFLKKNEWKITKIKNNDKIEIVTLVGGG